MPGRPKALREPTTPRGEVGAGGAGVARAAMPQETRRGSLSMARRTHAPEASLHPRQGPHQRRLSGIVKQNRQLLTPRWILDC